MEWTRGERMLLRAGFAFLAAISASIGVWATIAPRSFYDDYPGGGRHWVSALAPYNEHLVRDFAAASLGFVVLLLAAAVLLERRLVQVALLAYAVAGIPHLAYHLTTTAHYSTSDNVLTLTGLALAVVVPLGLFVLTLRRPARSSRAPGAAAR